MYIENAPVEVKVVVDGFVDHPDALPDMRKRRSGVVVNVWGYQADALSESCQHFPRNSVR
jgi:hypothetical protein